jgi:divalent metal cation (Fe/Co/Zn/Cd) transporter
VAHEDRLQWDAGFRVSALTVAWTVIASVVAVTVGLREQTVVLVAFGAIGIVDALGSTALVYHFHHARRHDELSEQIERVAHLVVLVGLTVVGTSAVVVGLARLALGQSGTTSAASVALAAVSLVALTLLSLRKLAVARRVRSAALRSDGHLSAVGAAQAAVALSSTAIDRWIGWHWVDALATAIVGTGAVAVAIVTWQETRADEPA